MKEKQKGSASGGIAFLIKKRLNQKLSIISSTNLWLIIHIEIEGFSFIIGHVYWRPTCDSDVCVQLLDDMLLELENANKYDNIVIGGDWNGRVGNLNQIDEDLLLGINLYGERVSLDNVINARGRKLAELMFLVNGRSASDKKGNYTL